MIPLYTQFTLPIQPAAFLVEKATEGNTVQLEVEVGKDKMQAKRALHWKGGRGVALGTYNLAIELCNGSC
jgi:hypothetical protein